MKTFSKLILIYFIVLLSINGLLAQTPIQMSKCLILNKEKKSEISIPINY